MSSGLFPQESALQNGWLSLVYFPDSPDPYSLLQAAGLEGFLEAGAGGNFSLGHTWL